MIDELRSPEMLRNLGRWRGAGHSWNHIKTLVERELGQNVDVQTIRNAYQVYSTRSAEIIAGDNELKGMLRDVVFDQTEQMRQINQHVNDLMNQEVINHFEDPKLFLDILKEVRAQIQLQRDLLNTMSEGINVQQINILEYTQRSVSNLKQLEDQKYIKIICNPGQVWKPYEIALDKKQQAIFDKHGEVLVDVFRIKKVNIIDAEVVEDGHSNQSPKEDKRRMDAGDFRGEEGEDGAPIQSEPISKIDIPR